MVIDISKLTANAPIDIHQSHTLDASLGFNLQQVSPVQITGKLSKQEDKGGDLFFFNLTVSGSLTFVCDKCTAPAPHQVDFTIQEQVKKPEDIKTPDEDADVVWVSKTKLDISPLLATYLYDNLPMQVLCVSDCQGLCASCGRSLNQGSCDCVAEPAPTDARFDILKTLKFD